MNKCLTITYASYRAMLNRCYNPRAINYNYYGGADVTVCERWLTGYTAFLEDMGERPDSSFTLNRKGESTEYRPNSCNWATKVEQSLNRKVFDNNTSGYRGVYKSHGKWRAQISANGKRYFLGHFSTKDLAALAYNQQSIKLNGVGAKLNIVQ